MATLGYRGLYVRLKTACTEATYDHRRVFLSSLSNNSLDIFVTFLPLCLNFSGVIIHKHVTIGGTRTKNKVPCKPKVLKLM